LQTDIVILLQLDQKQNFDISSLIETEMSELSDVGDMQFIQFCICYCYWL